MEILAVFPHLLPFLFSGLCCSHTCVSVFFQRCYAPLYVLTTAALETLYTKDELHWQATPTALVVLSSPVPRMERAFPTCIRKSLSKQIGSTACPGVTGQGPESCRAPSPLSHGHRQLETTAADEGLHDKVNEPGESIMWGRNPGTCQGELC